MRVQPMTEKEVQEAGLAPEGIHDFEVSDAEESSSKAGNEMLKLKLRIHAADGRQYSVFDYLVSTPGMAFKVRHFAETTGLLDEYEAGSMPAEIVLGKNGKVQLGVEPASGKFRAKNNVVDYVVGSSADKLAPQELDDEIPF